MWNLLDWVLRPKVMIPLMILFVVIGFVVNWFAYDGDWRCMVTDNCRIVHVDNKGSR